MPKVNFTQKALIFNSQGKFLIIKRSSTAPANAQKWDLPGGEIEIGEDPEEATRREIKEETHLEVADLTPYDVESHINNRGEFWVSVAYKTTTKQELVKLSFEHDEFRWVTKEEFSGFDSTPKINRFINKA
ncbi:MAG TPA: NUDIX domain-containing protein [Candidatus Saccharimonadales bacterium]|nr:NUDIX domain-containing protein [Candidatus Saccharimonadales bacterium]